MAQNITLLGGSYSDVPAVLLPKTGGGTARFDDASVTTAAASDVASGKVFLASDGTVTTGTASGGSLNFDVKSVSVNANAASVSFTGLSGEPKAFVVKLTGTVSSSGSTTYYYIVDVASFGTNTHGNYMRIGGTRRVESATTGYSFTYSSGTLTVTSSAASASATPGWFYKTTYELLYAY